MSNPERPIDKLLPLSSPVFQILLALARGERHGYAMMQEVEAATGGAMKLAPGTLYYSLQKMLERDFIAEGGERAADDVGDERRVYYRITEHGRRVAEAEARRLAALVDLAREREFLDPEEAR